MGFLECVTSALLKGTIAAPKRNVLHHGLAHGNAQTWIAYQIESNGTRLYRRSTCLSTAKDGLLTRSS